jgi:hypothetical protein
MASFRLGDHSKENRRNGRLPLPVLPTEPPSALEAFASGAS